MSVPISTRPVNGAAAKPRTPRGHQTGQPVDPVKAATHHLTEAARRYAEAAGLPPWSLASVAFRPSAAGIPGHVLPLTPEYVGRGSEAPGPVATPADKYRRMVAAVREWIHEAHPDADRIEVVEVDVVGGGRTLAYFHAANLDRDPYARGDALALPPAG